jgi:uncharacterized protein YbaR (Trm112 family)
VYIELIDLLRCPNDHDESWLVAAFNKMEGRFVIEGKLGCPVCNASYPITTGIADMRGDALPDPETSDAGRSSVEDEATALRIAAMLGLTRAGSIAVLVGVSPDIPGIVAEMTSTRVIGVNPTSAVHDEKENVALVYSGARLPFASASVDGIMLSSNASTGDVQEAVRVLATGGRLVAPATVELAGNLRELARDEHHIVAEFTGPLLSLSR